MNNQINGNEPPKKKFDIIESIWSIPLKGYCFKYTTISQRMFYVNFILEN